MSHLSKTLRLLCAAGLGMVIAMGAVASVEEGIAERLKPIGEVCLSGSDCAAAPVAAAPAGPRSAADIYSSKCAFCHDAGVAGAPKKGDVAAWAPRIGKGIDTLYGSAINGFNNVMPAKGGCLDCSDDEVKSVVDYLVESSK